MKSFLYTGPNSGNQSGVSWKIWKIERKGNRVIRRWSPLTVVKRKALPVSLLQRNERRFSSEDAAKKFEHELIQNKLAKGYKRSLRRSI